MSIIQSCQLCTLSSVDSLFEGVHMSLRLNYSSSLRCRSYCSTRSYIRSCAVNEQDLPEKSRFLVGKDRYQRSLRQTSLSQPDRIDRNSSEASVSKSNRRDGNSSTAWLDKWRETSQRFPRKGPREALNYRSRENVLRSFDSIGGSSGNNASGSTMERIVEKLKKFGYMDDGNEGGDDDQERRIEKGSVEDIFYVEEGMLPNTRGGFSNGLSLELDKMIDGKDEVLFPWEQPASKAEEAKNSVIRRSRTYVAELTLPESELRRLKNLTLKTKKKVRIGGSGVTQAVVDTIHQQWKSSEVVRLKVEGAPALNMKRMHEILERKTGGLVIWRSGTSVSLYRGVSYEVPQKERGSQKNGTQGRLMLDQDIRPFSQDYSDSKLSPEVRFQKTGETKRDVESAADVNYEDEMDKLLSDLGPRYEDWPGDDPLPVDADLLPNVVPGYQPPFRLLPYGVRRTLGMKESTSLRRIARTLPPHFALGRSRQLEGLAAAIVKLWEKSSIAKVALKRGVQLTTSEKMAEELKRLTGGVLLSRNKDFLVFYRGKDFLSSDVTEVLLERERLVNDLQDEEEHLRKRASASYIPSAGNKENAAGTLSETLDANSKWGKILDQHETEKVLRQAEIMRHADVVRKLERKLYFAERKLFKAEQTLSKVEESLKPADQQQDPESITDEERFMFRKLGLRMKAFLLLGRRGVFDGTVENMHLHWKYRELVKIIVKEKNLEDVKSIALALEAESGGVLVSVDKVSKGYAVIVFRGKDYERPRTLRPKNLLTKRKALARSIELQRREALLKHIAQVQQNVEKLKSEIEHMSIMEEKDQNNAAYYDKLDAAYSTEDEEVEDEGDEAYLTTYNDESDGDEADSSDFVNSTNNFKSQTTEEEAAEVQEEDETIGRFA